MWSQQNGYVQNNMIKGVFGSASMMLVGETTMALIQHWTTKPVKVGTSKPNQPKRIHVIVQYNGYQ